MKPSPALCTGVFAAAAVIALILNAEKSGEHAKDSSQAAINRQAVIPISASEHGEAASIHSDSAQGPPAPDASPASAEGDRFFRKHCASMLVAVRNEPNPDAREQLSTAFAAWMDERDPAAGLAFLGEQAPSDVIHDLQEGLLERWAVKDAAAAANAALILGGRNARESLGTVLGVWADEHLTEAIAWVNQMHDGVEKQAALLTLAVEAARTDPETAATLASDLPTSPERDETILHAASQWADTDPRSASDWARQINASPLRDRLLAMIATVLGDSDPIAGATLALDDLPPSKARDDAVVGIVQRWAQRDPNATAAWVRAFPEGALRDAVMENLVKLWADKEARPAGEWLNSLPPGASRDSGVRAFAEQIAPSSPRQAAAWAGTISDPQVRLAQLETIAKVWLAADPAAASIWLAQVPFSPEARSRILRR